MSQQTVHSCIRQGNQCRIALSFFGALVVSRIRNLFCNSAFSESPLWLSCRGAPRAPTQSAGLCSRACARIQQRLFWEHSPLWGQAVHGLWGQGAQTLPVSRFAAALSSTSRTRQGGCSKREWGDAAPGPPTVGHTPALPLAGGIKTGSCIKHHRAPATWKISVQVHFQSHCASILALSSNTLSPHIPQTGLWPALCPVPSPHVPCDSLLGPISLGTSRSKVSATPAAVISCCRSCL